MKKALVGIVVVGVVLAGLYCLLRTPEGPIVLAYKYKAGDKTEYQITMKTETNDPFIGAPTGSAQRSRLLLRRAVRKVSGDGSALIDVTCELHSGLYAYPGFRQHRVHVAFSATGRISPSCDPACDCEAVGVPGSGLLPMGLLGFSAVLPSRGVAVGECWTEMVPSPWGGGNLEVTSTLVSDRYRLGRRRVCRIENRYGGTIDTATVLEANRRHRGPPSMSGEIRVSGSGTVYFSREEGRVIRHDDKAKIISTTDMGYPPGADGSSTGVSRTFEIAAEAEATAVLVEKRGKGGGSKVSPSP